MIAGKKVLGLIPARGGSKGLPRKNVLPLAGKPLIAWTIAAALESRYIDRLVLSSEDDEIMAVAADYGCAAAFRRPEALATDSATTMGVLQHALDELPGFDIVVVLQPTTPLRLAEDIDGTMERLVAADAHSCVAVTEPEKSPCWSFGMHEDVLTPLLGEENMGKRRQELPGAWVLNGAVYAARCDWFRETGLLVGRGTLGYPMPKARSVDIDTAFDLGLAELLLRRTGVEDVPAEGYGMSSLQGHYSRTGVYSNVDASRPKCLFQVIGDRLDGVLAGRSDPSLLDVGGASGALAGYLKSRFPSVAAASLDSIPNCAGSVPAGFRQ